MSKGKFEIVSKEMINTHLSSSGEIYGKPCLKADGKAYALYADDMMVFKLGTPAVKTLVADYKGASAWNSGEKVLNDWLAVPAAFSNSWSTLALKALDFSKKA